MLTSTPTKQKEVCSPNCNKCPSTSTFMPSSTDAPATTKAPNVANTLKSSSKSSDSTSTKSSSKGSSITSKVSNFFSKISTSHSSDINYIMKHAEGITKQQKGWKHSQQLADRFNKEVKLALSFGS